ncbi:MAG: pentapeptide repeat-containing protein [Leptolyngbya sp. SIO3F4]|nr:pentapeptide repeat-containing protein [Leptolyngbya sp. SIO3F4]
MAHLYGWLKNCLIHFFPTKRQRKKSVNARLSKLERQFQKVPTWLVILLVCIPFYSAGVFVHDYDNYQGLCTGDIVSIECFRHLLSVAFESAETIAILSAIVLYLKEAPDRKDKKHYEAWQVVEQAENRETSYSRYKALQDLNNDNVSLEGLDAPGADLCYILLPESNLTDANLSHSDLSGADLSGADLITAALKGANLEAVNLQNARLNTANLCKATLIRANLENTDLEEANLEEANLQGANLSQANLERANLCGARLVKTKLIGANLEGANLQGANISGCSLDGANLEGANLDNVDLRDIRWSLQTTKWPNKNEVSRARNIPGKLKAKLGMELDKPLDNDEMTDLELS